MTDQTKTQTQPKPPVDVAPPQPAPATFTGQLPYEAFRAQQTMSDIEQGRALEMDQTVKGGRYLTADGTVVDADGKEITG